MVLGTFLPSIGPISEKGVSAIALTAAMVLLLAAQALPIGVMCFICILAQPLMGITESLSESASYWANYLFFFVIMAFNIGLAFSNTSLPRRMLLFMLQRVKKDARGPVLAIWLTTALLSGIIANFAVIALMLAFAWEYLSLFDDPVKKKKTGRCLLIGMCASTELGGNITPLGSSINIMVINFLNDCGYSISYAKWIAISLPLFVILFFLMTRILFALCPPEALNQEQIRECISSNQTSAALTPKEKKLLLIVSAMMILLLISPFIPALKSELIIVAAGILLMLPGIEAVTYDQLAKSEAFTQTIYICCFIGLAGILSSAGVVDAITAGFQSIMPSRPSVFAVVALLCILTIVMCNFLPAAAVPSVLTVPMITFCASVRIDPVLAVIPLAMCSNCSWILPLDPISLLTYGKGYYTLMDMVKPGLLLTAVTAAVTGGWMALLSLFI